MPKRLYLIAALGLVTASSCQRPNHYPDDDADLTELPTVKTMQPLIDQLMDVRNGSPHFLDLDDTDSSELAAYETFYAALNPDFKKQNDIRIDLGCNTIDIIDKDTDIGVELEYGAVNDPPRVIKNSLFIRNLILNLNPSH